MSLARQAVLLGIARSSIYAKETLLSSKALTLHKALDKIYTAHPYYGQRRMKIALKDEYDIDVGRDAIRTAMRILGLEALYPKHDTSKPNHLHRVYPYLLKHLHITHPNHVWGTDITYIPLEKGFCYLVAILDWYSRYVVSWKLSTSLEIDFCLANLNEALAIATPNIFNSDQGSHFTSPQHTSILETANVQISMDGRGRCLDNVFTERLWRTVKYEDVYLKGYATFDEVQRGLAAYFDFYNNQRKHQSLNYQTPASVYAA